MVNDGDSPNRATTCGTLPCRTTISAARTPLGSQSPQPHLEDSSVYRPLRPTREDSNPRL